MEDTSLTDFLDDGGAGSSSSNEGGADANATVEEPAEGGGSEDGKNEGEGIESAVEEESDEQTGGDGEADVQTEDDDLSRTDDASPAEPTASWSQKAATCESCGEAVDWRYRDGDALVCVECKSWE